MIRKTFTNHWNEGFFESTQPDSWDFELPGKEARSAWNALALYRNALEAEEALAWKEYENAYQAGIKQARTLKPEDVYELEHEARHAYLDACARLNESETVLGPKQEFEAKLKIFMDAWIEKEIDYNTDYLAFCVIFHRKSPKTEALAEALDTFERRKGLSDTAQAYARECERKALKPILDAHGKRFRKDAEANVQRNKPYALECLTRALVNGDGKEIETDTGIDAWFALQIWKQMRGEREKDGKTKADFENEWNDMQGIIKDAHAYLAKAGFY